MSIVFMFTIICSIMAIIELKKEHDYKVKRLKKQKNKQYSCVPWDAADKLDFILKEDKSKDKEYKLAALVIEDENGHASVEDIDLRGDDAGPVKLSEFASKRTRDKADSFLFDSSILKVISQKVNCEIERVERYYAFQITKENILSGRHGKKKTKIKKDYVMFLDLSSQELNRIANLSF